MASTGKPITLQDIARETGYSVNTVSHALRHKDDIAQETGEHIRQIAQKMGYTGNQIASSLRSGRTHLLALILSGMSNPFYALMADMIQDAAQAAGYTLIITCSRDDASLEEKLVEQAIARRVDGIILFPTNDSAANVARLKALGKPFVLMSRYLKEGDADCVVCDEEEGAYLATRHLIEGGHKKLAYISSTRVVYSSEQRIKGFLRACDALGIPESDRTIRVSNASILSRRQARGWQVTLANELRELKRQGFDGLFVFCDVEAWHALEVITNTEDLHMEDFGIVSFDNLEKALSYPVSICSVGCDYEEMARRCVELLRARIHRDTCPPRTVVCPVSLQCRKSCQKHRTSPDYRSGEAHNDIDSVVCKF